jgi:hypothetical protein
MVVANSQHRQQPTQDVRREATAFLNNGIGINRLQQEASADYYRQEMEAGRLSAGSNMHSTIREHGYLAQAMNITANRPSQAVRSFIRDQINNTQHPGGRTLTDVGDMRTLGHRSAADDRARNNGLEGVVTELTEEEQMQIAVMESQHPQDIGGSDDLTEEEQLQIAINESELTRTGVIHLQHPPPPRAASAPPTAFPNVASASGAIPASTPEVIARTRSAAFERRANTDKSNKKMRKNLSKVGRALSNPRDNAIVNLLMQYQNEPTPDRLDECIDFMEELED